MLSSVHYFSLLATILLVSLVGVYSLKFVKSSNDFAVGGRSMGPVMIAGSLVGAFVGGTSTIGTAQLAYRSGISAIWFTFGAGLACLVLGIWLAKPLREVEVDTIPQFLSTVYGGQVTVWAGVYTLIGIFIQIMAQMLALVPLVTSLIPIAPALAATLGGCLILIYVIFGGFWGTSLVGMVKLILLYTVLLGAGVFAYLKLGGVAAFQGRLADGPWLNLFPNGRAHDLAEGFSVLVGFISTQSYLQSVFAGKNSRASRGGVFITAGMLPLIGLACTSIGIYMGVNFPGLPPSLALPRFAVVSLPPYLGGVLIATLVISLIITGAGLTLGATTILVQDLGPKIFRLKPSLAAMRVTITLVTLSALGIVLVDTQALILKWAFLSMALRGVTVFMPLVAAIFFKTKVSPQNGVRAVALAPLGAIGWYVLGSPIVDPLYVGLFLSIILLLVPRALDRKITQNLQDSDVNQRND
jgi:solute:Na+ symporter, SSS family